MRRCSSLPGLASIFLIPIRGSCSFEPSTESKRKILQRVYTFLSRDNDARDNPESNLRKDEPRPVDPLVKGWSDEVDLAMD
jgi:hypothetical protein